jgi:hypothetical protein
MGGKGGPSRQEQQQQKDIAAGQLEIARNEEGHSNKLFDASFPGFQKAEGYYSKLASGDPNAIQQATAPATERIAANTEQTKKNISDTMPRGGSKDLALEEADITKSGQIGDVESKAYLGSFPALAQLAGEGIGLSVSEIQNALGGFSGASRTTADVANEKQASKSAELGLFGSLLGAGGQMAGAAI